MKAIALKLVLILLVLTFWYLIFFWLNHKRNSILVVSTPPASTIPIFVEDENEVVPQGETDALLAVFSKLDGAHWQKSNMLLDKYGYFSKLYPWPVKSSTPCQWHGVDCWKGHVVRLHLSGIIISGTFPIEITQLTQLEQLDLRYTPEGRCSLPKEFSQLKQMKIIDAVYSCLSYEKLPSEIKTMNIAFLTLIPGSDVGCIGQYCDSYLRYLRQLTQ